MAAYASDGVGRIVAALGLTQIIGYGTLYYSFGALAPSMAAEFSWPEEWVYGVLSVSLLAGGLVAPLSGRLADRHGAGKVMAWGSAAAALALTLCALAPDRLSFIAGLMAIEIASGFVLYATAFTALAQASSAGAQKSITHLTLIAGFASTVFWPLTSWLHQQMSWREVYLVYAALNLAVALPVHLWLASAVQQRRSSPRPQPAPAAAMVGQERHRLAMVMMLTAFALLGFASSAITVHMLPMLGALGIGGATAVVATLFGPAQVLSRLVNMQFGRRLPAPGLAVLAATLMPLGLALLIVTAPWAPGAAVFAILFGLGSGLSSIVSGTLPLALFGPDSYGQRLGWISSARLVASATAPFAFSIVAANSSMTAAIWLAAAVGLGAALAFSVIWWTFSGARSAVTRRPQDVGAK